MLVATWNVNSIRARLPRLLAWLARKSPDVVCLQETKCEDAKFPYDDITKAGYRAVHFGQRTYNGVAILAREEISDVVSGMGDAHEDPQARLIAGTVRGVRVISAYIPNGQSLESDKFVYKLQWLERLRGNLERSNALGGPLLLCGDFNVAPEARDCDNPEFWAGETLFHPDARAALGRVTSLGLTDLFRKHHEEGGLYSWWDYRAGAFHKNRGLRIDQIWGTSAALERCVSAEIDRDERKGEGPSDHAPVLVKLDVPA